MKTFILVIAILAITFPGYAQLENIIINQDMKFEKVYAGFNSTVSVPNDSLYPISMTAIRLGTALNWSVSNTFFVYAHGAIQASNLDKPFAIAAFVLYTQLTKKLQLSHFLLVLEWLVML